APSSANRSAIARPMPWPPPVTIATWPWSFMRRETAVRRDSHLRYGVRVGQLAVHAAEPRAFRLEHVAERQLLAVDMDRDRRRRVGILEHVVLERRDQRARFAHARVNHLLLLELDDALLGIATSHRVRRHADTPAIHALDAPVTGVIVERRALALVPHHDERGVAPGRITMQKPARVLIGRRLEEWLVDEVLSAAHDIGERALHIATSGLVV